MENQPASASKSGLVVLPAILDRSEVESLPRLLANGLNGGEGIVRLDFTKVEFIGTAALTQLLCFIQEKQRAGLAVQMTGLRPELRTLFSRLHWDAQWFESGLIRE